MTRVRDREVDVGAAQRLEAGLRLGSGGVALPINFASSRSNPSSAIALMSCSRLAK
jgi:hypothetical protein